jgi:hypothetical protein
MVTYIDMNVGYSYSTAGRGKEPQVIQLAALEDGWECTRGRGRGVRGGMLRNVAVRIFLKASLP